MKKNELKDFIEIFEKNQKLPHKSERKYIGFFFDFLRKIFSPFFEFFLARKFETQRKANLLILNEINDLKICIKSFIENFEEFKKFISSNLDEFKISTSKNLEELQSEILKIRDEKIPALKEAISIGLEGVDRKSEWALSNLVSLKNMISKEVKLTEKEKEIIKNSITFIDFSLKFRGSEGEIKKRQSIYIEKLKNRKMVVDLGCGRGEFLELLKENSISGIGVEKEPSLCAILKEKNLNFYEMDIFEFLEKRPLDFDCVVSFHLIEHLNLKEAIIFFKLLYKTLPKGGILLIETPNPTSLFSFLNFYKDPEHKTPWHPETLKFFLEEVGFKKLEDYYLEDVKISDNINLPESAKKLIFGPQDYGILLEKI